MALIVVMGSPQALRSMALQGQGARNGDGVAADVADSERAPTILRCWNPKIFIELQLSG